MHRGLQKVSTQLAKTLATLGTAIHVMTAMDILQLASKASKGVIRPTSIIIIDDGLQLCHGEQMVIRAC